jgi:hypothetical protein
MDFYPPTPEPSPRHLLAYPVRAPFQLSASAAPFVPAAVPVPDLDLLERQVVAEHLKIEAGMGRFGQYKLALSPKELRVHHRQVSRDAQCLLLAPGKELWFHLTLRSEQGEPMAAAQILSLTLQAAYEDHVPPCSFGVYLNQVCFGQWSESQSRCSLEGPVALCPESELVIKIVQLK